MKALHRFACAAFAIACAALPCGAANNHPENEAKTLAALAPVAAREGDRLTLRLLNGARKTLKNVTSCKGIKPAPPPDSECEWGYELTAYDRARHLFIINVYYYEGTDTLLVDDRTGRATIFDGEVVLSPAGDQALETLTVSYDPGAPAIRTWRRGRLGFVREWSRAVDPETNLVVVDWPSPDRIDIRSVSSGSAVRLGATKYLSLRRQGKSWRTEPDEVANREEEAAALCFAQVEAERAFYAIGQKFNGRMLYDDTYATKGEATVLLERAARNKACAARQEAVRRERLPGLQPSQDLLRHHDEQVLRYLTQGLITYGNANRLARDALWEANMREGAYFRGETERAKLTQEWRDRLQRLRPPTPLDGPRMSGCIWRDDNIACD